jgi:hypothetical protein
MPRVDEKETISFAGQAISHSGDGQLSKRHYGTVQPRSEISALRSRCAFAQCAFTWCAKSARRAGIETRRIHKMGARG